jgi:uncharacterized protein (TIGR02646 family)
VRPVERGNRPRDSQGHPRHFSEYVEARGELIARIGEYCSYCESRINASLAVEHVLSKQHLPRHELDWDNLLLACVNCNSSKGGKRIRLGSCYWPHRDNTARAFAYKADGVVTTAPGLTPAQRRRAMRTVRLTGLDKLPTNAPKASDRRWQHRREAWERAEIARSRLRGQDTESMRQCIVDQATALGYWSIWMAVFDGDTDMRRRLMHAFAGTCAGCFDARIRPVQRRGGAL